MPTIGFDGGVAPRGLRGLLGGTTRPEALVVIDLETTGGSPKAGAQVLEWGAALVVDGRMTQSVGTLIRPPRRADLQTAQARAARRVHGIRDAVVWSHGMELEAAAARCRRWLERIRERHGTVGMTAYNLAFERRFLDGDPWRLGALDRVDWAPCVLATARAALPKLRSHRLSTVARHLGVKAGTLHRARADAELAAEVWLALADRRLRP